MTKIPSTTLVFAKKQYINHTNMGKETPLGLRVILTRILEHYAKKRFKPVIH